MSSLADVLSFEKQVGVIDTIFGGLNPRNLPNGTLTTFNNNFTGNAGYYMEVQGTYQVGRFKEFGARGSTQGGEPVTRRSVTLLSAGEEKGVDPMAIVLLKAGEPANIMQVEAMIDNEKRTFLQRATNLRIAAAQSVFATGQISYDVDYNLLPDATGNKNSVDFKVPAGNKGDISGIIDASWALPGTNIPKQIVQINKKAEQGAGQGIQVAMYGDEILGYLATNDYVKNQWAGSAESLNNAIMANAIPPGFLGIDEWIYFGSAFYEDETGTKHNWIGGDDIIFSPTMNQSWWEIGQGSTPIASTYEPMSDLDAALDSVELLRGAYGYAFVDRNDMSVKYAQGDCFLPILKNGSVLFQADVTP